MYQVQKINILLKIKTFDTFHALLLLCIYYSIELAEVVLPLILKTDTKLPHIHELCRLHNCLFFLKVRVCFRLWCEHDTNIMRVIWNQF